MICIRAAHKLCLDQINPDHTGWNGTMGHLTPDHKMTSCKQSLVVSLLALRNHPAYSRQSLELNQ